MKEFAYVSLLASLVALGAVGACAFFTGLGLPPAADGSANDATGVGMFFLCASGLGVVFTCCHAINNSK